MANPSAITKSVDFEGVTYTVGEIRRVAAATALEAIKDGTAVAESLFATISYILFDQALLIHLSPTYI